MRILKATERKIIGDAYHIAVVRQALQDYAGAANPTDENPTEALASFSAILAELRSYRELGTPSQIRNQLAKKK